MLKETALGDLNHEITNTRRMLERIPDQHLGWQPHDRSWTLGELATHLVNLLTWNTRIAAQNHYDLAASGTTAGLSSREEILKRFDENVDRMNEATSGLTDEDLGQEWTLRRGDHVVMSMPRLAALRTMGINHMVHHRGQLSVYLRMLDVPVPGLYGPSADEK